MIKKTLSTIRERMEEALRSWTGRITPDGRIVIILVSLFLFSAGSIYMTVSSIYNMVKKNGRQMQIEHIERLEPIYKQQRDSINQINRVEYE